MMKGQMLIWVWGAAVLLCVSQHGCDKSDGNAASGGTNDGKTAQRAETTRPDKAEPTATGSADKGPATSMRLFEDPSEALAAVKKKVGSEKMTVLQLLIYPDNLQIQIQNQGNKENVDEYRWMGGEVKGPTPVQLTGSDATSLATMVFELSEADLDAVPKMAADAQKRVEVEGGRLTHILLRRQAGVGNDPKFRVYISGSRAHVSATYDAKGTFKKVWR